MALVRAIPAIAFAVALLMEPLGCDYVAIQLHFSGELVVYVHDSDIAIKGTVLEVVETGDSAVTDATGLARFELPPGRYTLRAWGIRTGGPDRPNDPPGTYLDRPFQVDADQETRIDIRDCPMCR